MSKKSVSIGCGSDIITLVFVIAVLLKLTGYTQCSWWIITAIIWVPAVISLVVLLTIAVLAITAFITFLIWVKWFEK
jgi:hypothetical protein